ncbi:hypothetical protein DPMN_034890 [Dreissena polymorpha]|uniref:Uncharacterized protein n=1 Tax=Dreissena polymorpha TaxID=45954 RepID=A0A9D4RKG0_DREPO|nr:hypothetical protein DPMN_034890 [Dreissena polymorpha]
MGEGGYLREKTDHERATRQRGFPQVPWERESIETCTVMNSLCYGSEIRQARRDAYREQDRIMSAQVMLTTITTGSKAEGVTDVFEGDRDIINLMAACDMEECQKRLWVQIISDMIEEGPTVLRRLPKIRHAINFHPEPLMWFSSKVLEIELLVLKYINRDCRDKNGVFNESDTMLQVIFRRTIETLDEVEQRMKVIGSRDFTEAINIVFGC